MQAVEQEWLSPGADVGRGRAPRLASRPWKALDQASAADVVFIATSKIWTGKVIDATRFDALTSPPWEPYQPQLCRQCSRLLEAIVLTSILL